MLIETITVSKYWIFTSYTKMAVDLGISPLTKFAFNPMQNKEGGGGALEARSNVHDV